MKHPIQDLLCKDQSVMAPNQFDYWVVRYGLTEEYSKMQATVKRTLSECYKKAKVDFLQLPFLKLEFLDIGEKAGAIHCEMGLLIMNPIHGVYDPNYAVITTMHEYAHLLDYLDGGKLRADMHDKRWQKACSFLEAGLLSPTHDLPTRMLIVQTLESRNTIKAEDFIYIDRRNDGY